MIKPKYTYPAPGLWQREGSKAHFTIDDRMPIGYCLSGLTKVQYVRKLSGQTFGERLQLK